jgi:hypothetical protein
MNRLKSFFLSLIPKKIQCQHDKKMLYGCPREGFKNLLKIILRSFLRQRNLNREETTVNRALDGGMYPSYKLMHSAFCKINYGGLKHNSLYLGLVLPSGG